MATFLIFLSLLVSYGIRRRNNAGNDFLSPKQTSAIKGIFICMVFLSHASGYVSEVGYKYNGIGDSLFLFVIGALGQCMVVMFMLYSGYGVMESVKKNGINYIRQMPVRRVLTTLLNFDIAVLIFAITSILLGREISATQFLWSLVALDSVGNSNWYIFVILLCYAIATISYFISYKTSPSHKRDRNGLLLLTAGCSAAILVLHFAGQPSWWYDTILAFCAGAAISAHRNWLDSFVSRRYSTILVMSILLFITSRALQPSLGLGLVGNMTTLSFAATTLLITYKINIGNPILNWMGEKLFPLYIYQRIPMLAIATLSPQFVMAHPVLFLAISAIVSAVLASQYKFIQIRLR